MLALVALLGTTAALVSPILMSILTNKNAIALKKQDWDRQDEVARRAEAAAIRNASLIAESTQMSAEASKVVVGKLDVIHTLVNSTLTAAMQVALDGVRREVVLLERDPATDFGLIESTKKKIAELEKIIEERNRQTEIADLQAQKEDAIRASKAVGIISPPMHVVTPPIQNVQVFGSVTDRVLRGEPAPLPASAPATAAPTEAQKAAQIDAASATVAAASKTADAAVKTADAAVKTVAAMKDTP